MITGLPNGTLTKEEEQLYGSLMYLFDSKRAKDVIFHLFREGLANKKTFKEIYVAFQEEWSSVWNYQHPDVRGDPLGFGKIGSKNIASYARVCAALSIALPERIYIGKVEPVGTPRCNFSVKTRHSTYWFGPYEKGVRTVTTDSQEELLRNKCMITKLEIGEPMEFDYPDDKRYCTTSCVVAIEQ